MYYSVYKNLKRGKKKDVLQASVFEELLDQSIVTSVDEAALKSAAGSEMSHLKVQFHYLTCQQFVISFILVAFEGIDLGGFVGG